MGAVDTTYTFGATDTITSTKMNNIIDQTTMTADAVLGGSGGSGGLDVSSGKLSISANAINSSRLATNSVTTNAITDLNVTTGKIADSAITSAKIADGAIVNVDVNASAAIAGTKISPNFGSQNVVTTGNVAGGTSTASAPIHGQRASASAGFAVLAKTTGVSNESGVYFDASNNAYLEARNGSATLTTSIKSSGNSFINGGNLGIGTSNPITPLHVNGGFKVTATENNNFSATVSNSGTTNAYGLIVESNDSAYALAVRDKSNVYRFRAGADGTVSMGGDGNSFNITAGGNVGIGTQNPSAKLHVVSGENPARFESNTTNNFVQLFTNEGSNNRVEICNRTGGRLALYTTGGGDALNILKTGQVGIGKTNPSTALDVNGTVTATAFAGPLTGAVTGNVTGNVTGSSGSCTGNAASADYATRAALGPVNGTFTQSHTANADKIYVGGFGPLGGTKGLGMVFQRDANEDARAVEFRNQSGTVIGSIQLPQTGNIIYATSSDYRLKEDLTSISNALSRINALKPTNFKWIGSDIHEDGFIAHELGDVMPSAVLGDKDAIDADGKPIYQQIDQSKLIPIMVAAIQELSQKVIELGSK